MHIITPGFYLSAINFSEVMLAHANDRLIFNSVCSQSLINMNEETSKMVVNRREKEAEEEAEEKANWIRFGLIWGMTEVTILLIVLCEMKLTPESKYMAAFTKCEARQKYYYIAILWKVAVSALLAIGSTCVRPSEYCEKTVYFTQKYLLFIFFLSTELAIACCSVVHIKYARHQHVRTNCSYNT